MKGARIRKLHKLSLRRTGTECEEQSKRYEETRHTHFSSSISHDWHHLFVEVKELRFSVKRSILTWIYKEVPRDY